MALENIPQNSKIIFSKLIFNMMNKNLITDEEAIKKKDLQYRKRQLRQEYVDLQEQHAAFSMNDNESRDEAVAYNVKMADAELDFLKANDQITKKELYYKRLEILHNILLNDINHSGISNDELYHELLEVIKDEVVFALTSKQDMIRVIRQSNVYTKALTKKEEYEYYDQLYNIQLQLQELKKVLKIDKVAELKAFPFDSLVNFSGDVILDRLYYEELYGEKRIPKAV